MADHVAFINVTRQCNVDCLRCYLTAENRARKERLSLRTLESFLNHHFWSDNQTVLIWEGGEATVVGQKIMREYCERARQILPYARQTMVTNCFAVPDWLPDLANEFFGQQVETTFALGKKASLKGDEAAYRLQFARGLNKLWQAGIRCPVNIELNRETIDAGVDALADFMLSTDCMAWEFDLSVNFESFRRRPEYAAGGVPILPLTVSYSEVWKFLAELEDRRGAELETAGISIGAFNQDPLTGNNQFNVASEKRFLTLNPDGVVTTNPLYSDLEGTHLGSLADETMAELLSNPNRARRVLAERRRAAMCSGCVHLDYCSGGPSHVPVFDGSGECAGGAALWNRALQRSHA
tara:strand:- start:66906 stop:67961 length:1056 start_codon:yes stop_codon:yes gene_type:complete